MLFALDYTRRIPAHGSLQPDLGLAQAAPLQAGVVVTRLVREGQLVTRGQPLFTVSAERVTKLGETTAESLLSLRKRQDNFRAELGNLARLNGEQMAALRQKLQDLETQRKQLETEHALQRSRVQSAQAQLARYQALGQSGFAPPQQVQERSDALLDQQARLAALERTATDLGAQINAARSDIQAQPSRYDTQKSDIERSLYGLQQEQGETESRRELTVVAPIAGIITSLQATEGQAVVAGQALASIVPARSRLQAWFYAPSSAIGFVRPGQRVQLRYAAFPYQKFGQYEGTVLEVSRSAQPGTALRADPAAVNQDPLYRVTVQPDKQSVLAYGRQEPLQADMLVEADILVDKRRIIEWIFEPLLAIKGKF
ncbi:HlyD family secretion protein [Chromobacterium sp. IIBBL 290-4]|uniref:HlyD family secretion protein n=1 Tax=Chromobacterium sp. IIBBL 290-4 TaxID=2953890 RepID=UPI0020B7AA7B|nr:HlyD family efflux transporter periplasmic adaptor subunit [Chromobacterium sp. IIBBL 290-4]UTH74972.1 HlyD family efflux transporter periplasmic adaptor subunit [Chromobacterium sp. IIBBL 290-4]